MSLIDRLGLELCSMDSFLTRLSFSVKSNESPTFLFTTFNKFFYMAWSLDFSFFDLRRLELCFLLFLRFFFSTNFSIMGSMRLLSSFYPVLAILSDVKVVRFSTQSL